MTENPIRTGSASNNVKNKETTGRKKRLGGGGWEEGEERGRGERERRGGEERGRGEGERRGGASAFIVLM